MLTSLSIKNFILIEELIVTFSKDFNILIGETGAGKSIIIEALMLTLGSRANSEVVRKGKNKSVIEAIFEFDNFHPIIKFLDKLSIDNFGNELIARREISAKGASRCFINDTPVTVSQLKSMGEIIADFHGQHDNQLLLKPENHVAVIDYFVENKSIFDNYIKEFDNQLSIISKLKSLSEQEKELKLQFDAFNYELNEILKISPKPDEIEKLEQELIILENSETLIENLTELISVLNNNDNSVYSGLMTSIEKIEKISQIDSVFKEYSTELNSTAITIQEIYKFANDYQSRIEYNPERIEEIRQRLSALNGLKKKYGSIDEVFERINYLENKLSLAQNFDSDIKKLKHEMIVSKKFLGKLGIIISKRRQESAKSFQKMITKKLYELSLPHVRFDVIITRNEVDNLSIDNISCVINNREYFCYRTGLDNLEFYITTNKGEESKPLSSVVSGGEISRIMLAIKSMTAEKDFIPLLVFDEIDTGISGKIAQKVGYSMKELAKHHQIIAITHLAQIASLGDKIISVKKIELENETVIQTKEENDASKINEIAKLISGEEVTENSLNTVSELLNYQKSN